MRGNIPRPEGGLLQSQGRQVVPQWMQQRADVPSTTSGDKRPHHVASTPVLRGRASAVPCPVCFLPPLPPKGESGRRFSPYLSLPFATARGRLGSGACVTEPASAARTGKGRELSNRARHLPQRRLLQVTPRKEREGPRHPSPARWTDVTVRARPPPRDSSWRSAQNEGWG